ncbi:MAG: PH domain-containing protein [Terriglobales bacterium]
MGFPQDLLAKDETVMVHQHSHWKVLFWPVVWLLIIGGAAGFLVVWFDQQVMQLIIAGVALLLVLYVFVRPLLKWLTTHFVLTTHRVLTRSGILYRKGRDVPLSRINDVSFEQSLFERMLGCGTLVVESAGERGEITLTDVPRVEYVQTTLYRLVEDASEPKDAGY